ncbi:MAG TPA: magnesium transporter [Geminicoccaceae bacterium]|nr:magnesium transporter [Geminicoccus sp.]HMU52059.1 magnesium transporter [Geminicoccaceae bacterium]
MEQAAQDREPEAVPAIGLDDALVAEVREALDRGEETLATGLVTALHAADQADLLQLLDPQERAALVRSLGETLDPETLSHLDEDVRDEVIEQLGPSATGSALARLETDDAVEVLEDLDAEDQAAILAELPAPDRALIETALAFPEESAGRLMQREVVAVPSHWNVGQAIDYLRATPDLPDDFYEIIIVDPRHHPVATVPVSKVLRGRRATPLTSLGDEALRLVPVGMNQEKVAFMFRQYGLVSAPVVSAEGRLLGVITVDDVVDVIDEEAEDDILKLGGVQETDMFAPPLRTGLKRLPWLLVNLGTALLGAAVIAHFEGAIERIVVLAALLPMVGSLGGNAGTQAMTVAVRSIAVKELTGANAWRTLLKELAVGALNGTAFLALGAGLVMLWMGDAELALVFGGALAINLVVASLAGLLVPLGLDRLGLDPAVSSGVFLSCITDLVGFVALLGLAVWILL